MTITLNDIRDHSPCTDGWTKLLSGLGKTKGDDEPLSFETILEINGIDDALWCLKSLPDEYDSQVRLLACDFAERVLKHVPEGEDRPRKSIETARKYAVGEATRDELDAASDDARDAAMASAGDAAGSSARAAADATAWAAAWDDDALADALAASRAAADAAGDEERAAQTQIFKKWIKENQL